MPIRTTPVDLESLLRAGHVETVRQIINSINGKKVPRGERLQYANIANRVDNSRVAYRLLFNLVRSPKLAVPPTDHEKIEFAEALRGLGLTGEAVRILKDIDVKTHPIAGLRIGFCLMDQWRYAEAIPYLRNYSSAISETEYLWLIANVNLAASLVAERHLDEAINLLNKLVTRTQNEKHQLLYGNCLELLTQVYVAQGRYDLVEQIETEAKSCFSEGTRYAMYLRKWIAISKSLKQNFVGRELLDCRAEAERDQIWEVVRDCDLYIGFLNQDSDLLRKIYFGTPSESFRKRIVKMVGDDLAAAGTYVWHQHQGTPVSTIFDVPNGKTESSDVGLEKGLLTHRLLLLLAADFYRPLSVVSAFSELFPDEDFSQTGSANRIAQLVLRLRVWLKNSGDFLEIEEADGAYRLKARAGVGLRVSCKKTNLSLEEINWADLKTALAHTAASEAYFSKKDVMNILGCSSSTAGRLLQWSRETGYSQAVGHGPTRKFRFTG